jgi:PEP-CTERM motif
LSHVNIGPPPFSLDPAILAYIRHNGEEYREQTGGLLPNTRNWRYLEERWSIDPERFDRNHPLIGQWITENYRLTHEPVPPVPAVSPPELPPVVVVQPSPPRVEGTPEPASWLLLGLGILVVWAWRRMA